MTRRTPDMTGKVSDINDPHRLYEMIGYRVYLKWREGNFDSARSVAEWREHGPDATGASIYDGYIDAALRRLGELNPQER
jgi:hypothetical protein